jgi:hypothetical protein
MPDRFVVKVDGYGWKRVFDARVGRFVSGRGGDEIGNLARRMNERGSAPERD